MKAAVWDGSIIEGRRSTTTKGTRLDAERALVSKIAQGGEIETVISRGITGEHFADEDCEKVFDFIVNHVRNYKTPPSLQAVKEKYPKFEFVIASDSVDYLMDRFITQVKRRMAKEMLLDLGDVSDDYDQGKDIDIHFLDAARQLATIVPTTQVARFSDAPKRIDQYHVDKAAGNAWGIKMGIPALDDKTLGIQSHELLVTAGWQGTGKSTLMQFMGFNAYLQSKKILFISLEMEARALLRKFDTMAVDMNYHDLKALELGDDAIERWSEHADRAFSEREERDIIIVDRIGSRTATGIFAETVRHKPDLVIVDYISLLDAPNSVGDKSWQKIGHISRELKLNAQTLGIPVIAAAQTNRESVSQGVKLETIAFSSAIGMDADLVVGLQQDEDMRLEKEMEVILVKNRDGAPGRVKMNWDMERMQFGERPPDGAFRKKKESSDYQSLDEEVAASEPVMSPGNPFRKA